MNTIIMPRTGNRVRVISVDDTRPELNGKTGRVVGRYSDRRPLVIFDDGPACTARDDGSWAITEWERIDPAIGDRVIAISIPGGADYNGQIGTVTEVQSDGLVVAEFKSIQKPDDSESLAFWEWAPVDGESEDSTPVAIYTQEDMDKYEAQINELRTRRNQWIHDFNVVTEALVEEAKRRGWCSEYEEFVDGVQSRLQVGSMPAREQEYEVTWTETYTVTVSRSGTYTAQSEEDAIEVAKQEDTADRYMLKDAIDCGAFSFDDDEDYEASEV